MSDILFTSKNTYKLKLKRKIPLEVLSLKKRLFNAAITCTVLGTSLLSATPVLADDYDAQIEQAQQEAQENEQAANSLDAIMNQLSNEVSNTQDAINSLNAEIQQNESALETALNDLETANQEMETLLEEIAVLEKDIENRSEKLEDQARMVQVNGNPANYFEFILNSESLSDVIGRIDIVTNLVKSNNRMMEAQVRDQEAVVEKSEETERKIVQQNALAEELETTTSNLEVQRVSHTALVAQLQLEQSNVASEQSELMAQRNEALEQVGALENDRENARLAAEQAEQERVEQAQAEEAPAEEVQEVAQAETQEQETAETPTVTPASSETERNERPAPEPAPVASTPTPAPEPEEESAPEPTPAPKPKPKPDPKPAPAPSGNVLSIGGQYIGTPYLWGGSTPSAFDCSGFTRYVFAQAGKTLNGNAASQYAQTTKVSNPQPGDLVFFGRSSVTHVGIYAGGGRFLGAQTSTGVAYTTVSQFSTYGAPLIGYGRVN